MDNRDKPLDPCRRWQRCIAFALALHSAGALAQTVLSLDEAVATAQRNDPWLEGSRYRQEALEAQAVAAETLPDPMVNVGMANLPTDTFDFNQEAMTQFQFGVSQTIPRGDSLELNRKRFAQLGEQQPWMRRDREAKVAVTVSQLWLDTWRATRSIDLIEQDRGLFEQLVDVAQSRYTTAVGQTRQQDLVRAQLELTRLEDRLAMLHEQLEMSRSRLGEWLRTGQPGAGGGAEERPLAAELPDLAPREPALFAAQATLAPADIADHLVNHPAILMLDAAIAAQETGVELAQQQYKPEWRVNAGYGYREEAQNGMQRPDFFSVGVAFDLPLFTAKRQDQQVQSAVASAEAARTDRSLALRSMVSAFETQRARLLRLEQRRTLYRDRLLQEMHEQAEAALSAYTSDSGDFAEVVRSRIAELNARIDALDIEVERLKTIAQLNYFFAAGDGA